MSADKSSNADQASSASHVDLETNESDETLKHIDSAKITVHTAEFVNAVTTELDLVDKFVFMIDEKDNAFDEMSVKAQLQKIDESKAAITHLYDVLCSLCNNKIDKSIENMFKSFCDEMTKVSQTLDQRLKSYYQEMGERIEIEHARKELEGQMAKFNMLMEKRAERIAKLEQVSISTGTPGRTSNTENGRNHTPTTSFSYANPPDTGIRAVQELAQCLVTTMKSTKRTAIEPNVFEGNPMEFGDWEMDFDAYFESEGVVGKEQVRYLKRFVAGEARDAISGYLSSNSEDAYFAARQQLKDRFGNQHSVSRALRKKLTDWPKIGAKDSDGLRKFADFLSHCSSMMRTMPELNILNDCEKNEELVVKLPDWMIPRWARAVKEKKRTEYRYPTFPEFAYFVADEAEVMAEPIMKAQHKAQLHAKQQKERSVAHVHPKETQQRIRGVNSFYSSANQGKECLFCGLKNHNTAECFKLGARDYSERTHFASEQKLCFSCLKPGHRSNQCHHKATCKKCKKMHPTSLHKDAQDWKREEHAQKGVTESKEQSNSQVPKENKETKEESTKINVKASQTDGNVLSMVLPVYVSTSDNTKEVLVYALLDTQSDASFIAADVAASIKPKVTTELVTLGTLNCESKEKMNRYHNLQIRGYNSDNTATLSAFELNNIPCERNQIPNKINVSSYTHLKEVAKKLPPPLDIPIGLLIGIDCPEAFAPLEAVLGGAGQPFAQKTALGWTVCGGKGVATRKGNNHIKINVNRAIISALDRDFEDLQKDDEATISQDDIMFMDIMENQTSRQPDGSYQMPLPFKRRPILPNNKIQAIKRLRSLEKKFANDKVFESEYCNFMDELLQNHHAEPVPEEEKERNDGEVWYIPHFAVAHPKKKKLRIVFDCSAVYSGTSLNKNLLQGPDQLNSLLGILCRFRKEPIAIACDIEKMYYNFYVNEADRDYLRFVWYDKEGDMTDYRMTVHLFGATSSPAVATYGLRRLAKNFAHNLPEAEEFIRKNFYVDDGISSVESVEKAKKLIADAREICAHGNLRLHKFLCNDREVMSSIPETERSVKDLNLFTDCLPNQRTLGLEWSVESDLLIFNNNLQLKPATRRGILSIVSQIYDPLGFLAPFTLLGKNILQKINQQGLDWDEDIGMELESEWKRWSEQLLHLDSIRVPRCIKPNGFGKVIHTEIHHFSDASFSGYGACSYIRMINENQQVHCSFLIGKARVAPLKGTITIPRLELQGAVIATRLSLILRRELNLTVDQEYFWTDSKIVLGYLANDTKRFRIYVANRIHEIKKSSEPHQWYYIPGYTNPADIASRGLECDRIAKSDWLTGPEFLHKTDISKELALKHLDPPKVDPNDDEIKKVQNFKTNTVTTKSLAHQFEKYGSFKSLTRAVAHLQGMAATKSWIIAPLSNEQLQKARQLIFRVTQEQFYERECMSLKAKSKVENSSDILKLNPFMDENGIVRVGGRSARSLALSKEEKFPIIIPKNSHLAKLLVLEYHANSHHLGKTYTQAALREAGFWIISSNRIVKNIIKNCTTCNKTRRAPEQQQMGQLPEERLEQTAPFTNIGVDCFGPFYIKERRTELKKWGVMFTCLYSRAVHIEVIDDLSTDAFINALRCFLTIRGPVNTIFCDHGTNFMGTRTELDRQLNLIEDGLLKDYLQYKQIQFKTTTPTASHQGGVWERQIRTARSILNTMSQKFSGRLDTATLRTALYEVMCTMNSRPLTVANINEPTESVITPNHLLTMKSSQVPPPPGTFDDQNIYGRIRWKQSQAFAEEFWNKWKVEYLSNITQRQKWHTRKENITVGDIVLVVENDQPRNLWRLGRVEEVKAGKDGAVRNVSVRIATKMLDRKGKPIEKTVILERPIQKLVLIMHAST